VLTGTQLDGALLGATWAELGRRPLSFETSQPLVFAIGDVRSGSMKRVAAAVGDGAWAPPVIARGSPRRRSPVCKLP
jgi:thioredoxin reductase (NADPH)